jgi:glycosyltransferase involved in cell wall biosynthesis
MHVGFLSFESPFGRGGGGIAAYLRAMIPALIGEGHRVTLIAPADGRETSRRPPTLRIVPVRLPNAHWYASKFPPARRLLSLPLRELEWSLAFHRGVVLAMRDEPMDVLEVPELGAWRLARHPPSPLVARLHGADYTFRRYTGEALTPGSAWSRRLQRRVLRSAAQVTAPSQFQAAEVAREMGWPVETITVVPNAISPDMLERAEQALDGSTPRRGPPMILYAGRLAAVKGTLLLLEAATRVLRVFPEAEFVLAGPWQLSLPPSEWARLVSRADAGTRITWLGHQDGEGLAALYRRAAVFVLPSHYESFGIACVEAMAFRVPVVATSAGALPEIVEDQHVGLIVAPGDPEALANAISRLVADPDLGRRLGDAGRARVLSRFTPEIVKDRMLKVYERARSGRR